MATQGVTWQWLAGIATSVVLLGGTAWMGALNGDVNRVKEEQKADRASASATDRRVGIIDEQTKRTQEDVREIKETQKETNKKLDELLRRR